jgi:hypothetical protein
MSIWPSFLAIFVALTAQSFQERAPGRRAPAPEGTAVVRGSVLIEGSDVSVARLPVFAVWMEASDRSGPPPRYETMTDDSGQFEIRGLPAGRFRLAASVPRERAQLVPRWVRGPFEGGRDIELTEGQVMEKVVLTVERAGVIVGRVVNEFGEPVPYARVIALQRRPGSSQPAAMGAPRETDDLGRFRLFALAPGEHYIKVEPSFERPPEEAGDTPLQHLETYYPGVDSIGEAQAVHVAAGQEVGEIEVPLRRGRTFRVSGIVLDSRGAPAAGAEVMYFADNRGSGESANADGSFTLSRLPAGEYTFQASTARFPQSDEPEQSSPLTMRVDSDIDGLTLTMRRSVKVTGRIVVEGEPPIRPGGIHVMAMPPQRRRFMGFPAAAISREDGTFSIETFDNVLIRPQLEPPWNVKAVRFKGADVTDVFTDFSEGPDSPHVDVIVSNRGGTIAGHLENAGVEAERAMVVVFAEDTGKWFGGASTTRLTIVAEDGSFEVPGLRPERYLAAATVLDESVDFAEPRALFEKLAAHATAAVITGEERRELSLPLVAIPQ